jgi:type II secretory pathway pseudopilin PulG
MYLEGQGVRGFRPVSDRGYAMAALLVSLGVMAVLMTAALPVWRHQAQREKEAELVFRGEQYARAVGLFQRKMGPGTVPPSIDVLVQQKFLRKKYKDPMVPDGEFQVVPFGGTPQPGQPGLGQPGRGQPGASQPGRVGQPPPQLPGRGPSPQFGSQPPGQSGSFTGGGVMGVVSKSKEASIRIYRGASYYNQWRFIWVQPQPGPGQGGPGRGGPGRGGPGRGAPGRGGPGGPGIGGPMGPGSGPGRGTIPNPGRPGPGMPGRGGRGPGL